MTLQVFLGLVVLLLGGLLVGAVIAFGWYAIRKPREAMATVGTALVGMSRHRLRAFLSTTGIAVGVATLMLIYALTQGLTASFAHQLAQMGANTLYVSRAPFFQRGDWWMFRNRPPITIDDARALKGHQGVLTAVAPMAFSAADVSLAGEHMSGVAVRGTTSDYAETANIKLDLGRFLTPLEGDMDRSVVVIGSEVRERLFHGGDPIGARILVGDRQFQVVGLLTQMGTSFGQSLDSQVIIPIESFMRQFGNKRGVLITAASLPENLTAAEDEIIEVMRQSRGLSGEQEDNFAINRQSEIVKMFNEEMAMLYGVALVIGIITLLVGAIGVMNIMLVAVTERTREIGVRRALGATRFAVLAQFLIEAIFVTLVGGAIGTTLGLGGAWLLAQTTPVPAAASLAAGLRGLVISGIVGFLAGTWPAWRAAQLDPIESLRYE